MLPFRNIYGFPIMHISREHCSQSSYVIKTGFCFCHCYCRRMPQAGDSAHFIIQGQPLLNFCFLQCPLSLKAKDYLNVFPPTGRVAHTVSPEAMIHNTLCICLLQNCKAGTFVCRPRGSFPWHPPSQLSKKGRSCNSHHSFIFFICKHEDVP